MAIQTSTGVRLSISSGIPVSYDLAGYGALNYVEIGEITNIPQFGAAFQTVTNSPLASGVVQKRKGFVDYGNPVIDMALDNGNSGQQMMRAACDGIRKNQAHAFKLTYGDGELRYWSARVFSFQEVPGSANNMVGATSTIGITRAILQIPRITLDLAFSDDVYSLNGEVKNFSDIITFSRSTTGTYINQSGVLTAAAIDEPRLSYGPETGESLGLLIEGSSTNLSTYSEQFDNAAWFKEGATVIANSATAPDGASTMDMLVEDSTLGLHRFYHSVIVSAGTVSYSVFVKASGRDEITMIANVTGGSSSSDTVFSLSSGSIISGADGADIHAFGGGIFRISKTYSADGGTFVPVTSLSVGGLVDYQGDGASGVYIWGAQLEQKPYVTSYIKTEASQVTRAADLASVDDLSAWYNQSGGSVFVEFSSNNIVNALVGVGSSISNRFDVYRFSDAYAALSAAAEGDYSASRPAGSGNKLCGTIGASANSLSYEGVATTSVKPSFSAFTTMWIGALSNGDYQTDGHIKTLSYFPAPLSQSEAELITL